MVRVFAHGLFLAGPEGVWAGGTHGLEHRPGPPVYLPAQTRREPDVCHGCASSWLGVVY